MAKLVSRIQNRQQVVQLRYLHDLANEISRDSSIAEKYDAVREVTVDPYRHGRAPHPTYDEFERFHEPFNAILRSIKHLKVLTWNDGPISTSILQTLKDCHPNAKLKLMRYYQWRTPTILDDPALAILATFSNLSHLRYAPEGRHSDMSSTCREDFDSFTRIVRSNASITYAGFVIGRRPDGIIDLESIGADLDTIKRPSALRRMTLDLPQQSITGSALSNLNRTIKIDQLETFKFSRGDMSADYFQNAAVLLPNLKEVSLNFGSIPRTAEAPSLILTAAKEYLLSCQPLTVLSIWQARDFITIEELVKYHGAKLEVLQVHEKESSAFTQDGDGYVRQLTSLTDVQAIRQHCMNLRELTIDVKRNPKSTFELSSDSHMQDLLQEIANFNPPLRKVNIYHDTHQVQEFLTGRLLNLPELQSEADDESGDTQDNDDDESNTDADDESDSDEVSVPSDTADYTIYFGDWLPKQEHILNNYVCSIWDHIFGKVSCSF